MDHQQTSNSSPGSPSSTSWSTGEQESIDQDSSSSLLPVAAVCNNLDLYINSLRTSRFVGAILEEVDQLEDGSFVVASSCIDSKYNAGYVTRFPSLEAIPASATDCLYINPGFGPISSMVTTSERSTLKSTSSAPPLIFGGFDSGAVVAFSQSQLEIVETKRLFHNVVSRIRLSAGAASPRLLAADLSGRLVVLDVETFDPLKVFDYAHDGPVYDAVWPSLAHHRSAGDSLFLSAGGDNEILAWDLRTTTPATLVPPAKAVLCCSSAPTALLWPTEAEMLFGTEAGNLVRFDLRSKRALAVQAAFNDRPIRKIVPVKCLGGGGRDIIAVIADDSPEVLYYDRKNLEPGAVPLSRQSYGFDVRSVVEIVSGGGGDQDGLQTSSSRLVTIGTGGGISVQHSSDIIR